MQSSLRKTIRKLIHLVELYKKELKSPIKVRISDKLRMWKSGFLSESYLIYALQNHNQSEYLSDYARFVRTPEINGRYSAVLNDKLYFACVLHDFEQYSPQLYALIAHRRTHFFDRTIAKNAPTIMELCMMKGSIVLKPLGGGGGEGVLVMRINNGEIVVNGKAVSSETLPSLLGHLEDYLVTEFIDQHEYSSTIFPSTTNTIRAVTMWDDEEGEPFLAVAVHRFGRRSSGHVDNWTLGGLSVPIDLESGELGKGVSYPVSGELLFYERHPDTQEQIEGVRIPHWEFVKSTILEIAGALSFVPYIGWDIIVTEKAFKIIEGNNRTDVNLLQVHGPLLRQERIRKFYQKRGVLRN